MDETLDQSGLENLLGGTGGAETTNPPPAESAGEGGSGAEAAPARTQAAAWTSQLPKELRDNAELFAKLRDFKTIGDLARAYASKPDTPAAVQAAVPTSTAAGEAELDLSDVKGILEKLGAPKENERYDFEKDLKQELAKYGDIARAAQLTRTQAQAMLDGYKNMMEARRQGYLAEAKARAPEIASALVGEFGADGAAWYRKAVDKGALNALLAQSGLGANKQLARALVLLGREMSEDFTPSGGGGRGEAEPVSWRDGARFERK